MLKLKKILGIIFLIGIFWLTYSFFYSTYENIKVNKMIKGFKERSIYQEELDTKIEGVITYHRKYHKVPRETLHEKQDNRNVFFDNEKMLLGRDGDIYLTQDSPFKGIFGVHQFITYYYGGHAALLYYEEGEQRLIETVGFPDEDEKILDYIFNKELGDYSKLATTFITSFNFFQIPSPYMENQYYDYFYRDKYIGVRPVNHFVDENNSEELYMSYIDEVIKSGKEIVKSNALYNFLFFLDMKNKYYCTDLISRTYEEAYEKVFNNNENYKSAGYGKKMNDDGFITSVNDVILSKDTFINFYVEIKEELINNEKQIVEYIYYLEDVE